MKFNQILPVIAIYVVALGGCSNTTPDYSEFYKDPETVKEEDPSLNDNQIKVMSFNIRYYNTNDTGDKSWETRTTAFIPMIEDQKPTVIGIQEALASTVEVVGRELERLWIYRQGTPCQQCQQ